LQTTYSIGELSHALGVTPRTLRFYEDKGLIHPRRQGLSRIYSGRDRARLELILLGRRVGFSLAEIKAMLDHSELGEGRTAQLRLALSHFGRQLERLATQKRDIDTAIGAVARTMAVVEGMLRQRELADGSDMHATVVMEAAE
jgi:DNA-binding transcriptional MerR regulator